MVSTSSTSDKGLSTSDKSLSTSDKSLSTGDGTGLDNFDQLFPSSLCDGVTD